MFKSNKYSLEFKGNLFICRNCFKNKVSNSQLLKVLRLVSFQYKNILPLQTSDNFKSILSYFLSIQLFNLIKLIREFSSKLKSNYIYKYPAVIFHAAVFIRCVTTIRKRKTTLFFN